MAKVIDPLDYESSRSQAAFQIACMPSRYWGDPPFSMEIRGVGFCGGRDFTRNELEGLRDWIDAALQATEEHREAAE